MTEGDLNILKANVGKVIRVRFRDGETSLVKIHLVSDEEKDVIYDLLSTDKESNYKKYDEPPAYLAGFDEILGVDLVDSEDA